MISPLTAHRLTRPRPLGILGPDNGGDSRLSGSGTLIKVDIAREGIYYFYPSLVIDRTLRWRYR
ncbi:hypothetical protein PISMIDRAFT_413789 [Pisolithus microcarpus 441]|uniref:Uncharacterized protein n=1 Tax=Pisolithus microcarpus 441 TaxID=765257 RepID=A0A0C9YGS1_9AGAM|nr:hypothetical protein PISMIDRAFT_457592 [Pisolithus microcarpus 441]KIK13099.1 hypothetical protein PISMIDRAFT_413789 [Pisolithus microcarpus 441]